MEDVTEVRTGKFVDGLLRCAVAPRQTDVVSALSGEIRLEMSVEGERCSQRLSIVTAIGWVDWRLSVTADD
jgi:hypothetical protein